MLTYADTYATHRGQHTTAAPKKKKELACKGTHASREAHDSCRLLSVSDSQFPAYGSIRQHTSAYDSIRQRTAAYGSIRQHTSAYGSIRQHAEVAERMYATELRGSYTSSSRP
jgi:hypothetical protein